MMNGVAKLLPLFGGYGNDSSGQRENISVDSKRGTR